MSFSFGDFLKSFSLALIDRFYGVGCHVQHYFIVGFFFALKVDKYLQNMCNRSVFGYVSLGDCQAKSSQTDRHKVIELVDGYKMRFRSIQIRSTGFRACDNKN